MVNLYLLNFPSLFSLIKFKSISREICQFTAELDIPMELTISDCEGFFFSTMKNRISLAVS
jgi:hypothetical protein